MPAFTNKALDSATDPRPTAPVRLYNIDGYERNQPVVQSFTGGGVAATQMGLTTAFAERHRVTSATLHFNTPVTATIQLTLVSAINGSYNTVLLTQGLASNQDLFWQPSTDLVQGTNDELKFTSTGLVSGNAWFLRVMGEAW